MGVEIMILNMVGGGSKVVTGVKTLDTRSASITIPELGNNDNYIIAIVPSGGSLAVGDCLSMVVVGDVNQAPFLNYSSMTAGSVLRIGNILQIQHSSTMVYMPAGTYYYIAWRS